MGRWLAPGLCQRGLASTLLQVVPFGTLASPVALLAAAKTGKIAILAGMVLHGLAGDWADGLADHPLIPPVRVQGARVGGEAIHAGVRGKTFNNGLSLTCNLAPVLTHCL
ncbi:MAG: hypothetical protein GY696_04225 [Gammaproteobacteria bacterium]|nr:hypothetical protein [Gammaproteobacteria bacterium]